MRAAQQDSIKLLQWMMVASLALPLAIFTYVSSVAFLGISNGSERQILRTLDIAHEHATKVFETVFQAIGQTNEIVRDLSDDQIRADGERIHMRLKRLDDSLTQIKSLWLFDAQGRPVVNSLAYPTDTGDYSDRDYFRVHAKGDTGLFVGRVLAARFVNKGEPFFSVSQRRPTADGSFGGIVNVAVVPEYFEQFYSRLGRDDGSFSTLVRADGTLLARYPFVDTLKGASLADTAFTRSLAAHPTSGMLTLRSPVDGVERRMAYQKLTGIPVYVITGIEVRAIREEWFSTIGTYLIFGLPATTAVFLVLGIALRRTRKLAEEASRRMDAEDALKHSQRLEALGQLTGGVAHDFNNLLMVIAGAVSQLQRRGVATDPKDVRLLDMIKTSAERGGSLTRQLLSFSRRQNLAPRVLDLCRHIGQFEDVLKRSLRGDIEIKLAIPDSPCSVLVDPNELEIALLNLCLNARDAMPTGGTLDLRLKAVNLREKGSDNLSGEFFRISITDSGCGIPPEVEQRIFEPFFTTKTVDKGTGLGLSQVYGFAKQAGGMVSVSSTVGVGTTFTIYLPRSEQEIEAVSVAETRAVSPKRDETVLVVEDHADVAEVASAYIRQLGFNVRVAVSGVDALASLQADPNVDAVFSDIVMPGGTDGIQLSRILRETHPGIPVVLATGYSGGSDEARAEGLAVIQKPYSLEDLDAALQKVLDPEMFPAALP